jgi:hypothetical protein
VPVVVAKPKLPVAAIAKPKPKPRQIPVVAAVVAPVAEKFAPVASNIKAPKILAATRTTSSTTELPSPEVKVANESAWLSLASPLTDSPAAGGMVAAADESSDFKKFQRLKEEKQIREKAQAERAELQRSEHEARRKAAAVEAEEARTRKIQEAKDEVARVAKIEEEKKTTALADAQRLREEAKQKREAQAATVDLHEQSAAMDTFGIDE